MGFIDAEAVELRVLGESRWELLSPLTYRGRDEIFTVPAGTLTDLASVPGFLTWLVPRYGRYTKAAILHDHLWAASSPVSRADADGIFRRSMRELGVPILRRWAMWAAVRTTGIVSRRSGEGPPALRTVLGVGAIALVAIPVVTPAATAVVVTLVVVFVAEQGARVVAELVYRLRPGERSDEHPVVNEPHLVWRLS